MPSPSNVGCAPLSPPPKKRKKINKEEKEERIKEEKELTFSLFCPFFLFFFGLCYSSLYFLFLCFLGAAELLL